MPFTKDVEYVTYPWYTPSRFWTVGIVSIPDNVKGIVKVPDTAVNCNGYSVTVNDFRSKAFSSKDKVIDIVLPHSVGNITAGAFEGCINLKNITLSKNIITIKEGTCAGCDNLENVYFEGNEEEWKNINITHQKHILDFNNLISGTPVQKIESGKFVRIPGNDALLKANIHFYCNLGLIKEKTAQQNVRSNFVLLNFARVMLQLHSANVN